MSVPVTKGREAFDKPNVSPASSFLRESWIPQELILLSVVPTDVGRIDRPIRSTGAPLAWLGRIRGLWSEPHSRWWTLLGHAVNHSLPDSRGLTTRLLQGFSYRS